MNEVDTVLQKQITDLSDKFNSHIMSRLENDKHIAVSLQRIEDTMRSVDEQVKKTNGRVTNHDVQFTEVLPKMNVLYAAYSQEVINKEKNRGRWLDYAIKVGLVILGIILTKLNIINFNLPI